jgi:hypothetical protein
LATRRWSDARASVPIASADTPIADRDRASDGSASLSCDCPCVLVALLADLKVGA